MGVLGLKATARPQASRGLRRRLGWAIRAAGLMLGLAASAGACGARSGPDSDPGEFGGTGPAVGAGAGSSSLPPGPCAMCDGQIECGHCLIEAYEWTYRCVPMAPPPGDGCWDLREQHVDQYGRPYTCYYCP